MGGLVWWEGNCGLTRKVTKFNRISSIHGAQWLIHQYLAVSYLPLLIFLYQGLDIDLGTGQGNKSMLIAWADSAQTISTVGKWGLEFDDIECRAVVGSIPEILLPG